MKLRIAWIGKTRGAPIQSLTAEYLKRLSRFAGCEALELGSEEALLKLVDKSTARTPPVLVLLDSRGKQLASEEIANFLDYHQSHGTQELLFAIGPGRWLERLHPRSGEPHRVLRKDHTAARVGTRRPAGAALSRLHDSEGPSLPRWTLAAASAGASPAKSRAGLSRSVRVPWFGMEQRRSESWSRHDAIRATY